MPVIQKPALIAFNGFVCLVLAMGIGRFAYTPVLPVMLEDDVLDIGTAGTIASIHFIGYAMGAFASAFVIATPRVMLLGSLVIVASSTVAMGLSDSHTVWFAARWLAGFTSAVILIIVSTYHIRYLSNERRGNLHGWVFAGVGAGIMLVGLLALALMILDVRSHVIWLGFGGLAGIGTMYLFVQQVDLTRPSIAANPYQESRRTPLSWAIILPYAAMGFGYIVPATYLPVMAKAILPSPLIFGMGWPIFGMAAAISTVLIGRFQERFSNRQIWSLSQCVMALGLLAPVVHQSIYAIIFAALCVGGTFMIITMVGMKEAHKIAGPGDAQRHIAAMTLAFAAGQIIGPLVASWAVETTGSFSYPLALAGALLLISLLPMMKAAAQR